MPRLTLISLRILAVGVLVLPVVLFAVVPNDLGLLSDDPGAFFSAVTINDGAGDQYHPHVSGDIAAYTDGATIRYYNFFSGDDLEVPTELGASDELSDVSNGKIVFSRLDASFSRSIQVFDIASAVTTEIDPQQPSDRSWPTIGANTVAFIDHQLTPEGELLVADLTTSGATRITTDTRFDDFPSASPDGSRVVWESCGTLGNCDIREAVRVGPSSWTVNVITNTTEPESWPHTDGTVIVYEAVRSGERDIFWQPVGGGAEQQLVLAGEQRNASVSGGLVAFESRAGGENNNAEVMIYHIATNRLFGITFTPSLDESLSDVVALPNDQFRIVFNRGLVGVRDVYGVTFTLPPVGTFTFGGFLQPVDPYPTDNTMKAGAAVAVKFSLGGFQGLNIFAPGFPKSEPMGCSLAEVPVEQTVTAGGSSLQYDATSDVYTYVWKTEKGWAGSCRQLVIQFTDGSMAYANFKFK